LNLDPQRPARCLGLFVAFSPRNEDSLRKAISEIGVAALVLERARMKFGDDQTHAKLVYSASLLLEKIARPSLDAAAHQGTQLINHETQGLLIVWRQLQFAGPRIGW
jgi:hypothetical protein